MQLSQSLGIHLPVYIEPLWSVLNNGKLNGLRNGPCCTIIPKYHQTYCRPITHVTVDHDASLLNASVCTALVPSFTTTTSSGH